LRILSFNPLLSLAATRAMVARDSTLLSGRCDGKTVYKILSAIFGLLSHVENA
jgi:hypothetical protein